MFAEVIIDIAHSEVDKVFDYKIDDPSVTTGCRVEVPFGRQKTEGFVIGIKEHTDHRRRYDRRVEYRRHYAFPDCPTDDSGDGDGIDRQHRGLRRLPLINKVQFIECGALCRAPQGARP